MAQQKTSPPKNDNSPPIPDDSRGMSLIEILVVLFIIAAISSVFLPRLSVNQDSSAQILRRLANLSKQVHDTARLSNSSYRLVLDLRTDGNHRYWVERAQGLVPLRTQEQLEDLEKLTVIQREAILQKEPFQPDERLVKEPIELPKELRIVEVEIAGRDAPLTEGRVAIHFQPRGLVEEAIIRLQSEERLKWSLLINPLTGRGQLVDYFVYLKDLEQ